MSAQTKGVDVLAVMDAMFQGLQPISSNLTATEYSVMRDMRELKYSQARAAYAELIEAARDVERRAGPDREPRLRAAIARCGGA